MKPGGHERISICLSYLYLSVYFYLLPLTCLSISLVLFPLRPWPTAGLLKAQSPRSHYSYETETRVQLPFDSHFLSLGTHSSSFYSAPIWKHLAMYLPVWKSQAIAPAKHHSSLWTMGMNTSSFLTRCLHVHRDNLARNKTKPVWVVLFNCKALEKFYFAVLYFNLRHCS